jgi:uncharacterized protein (DUF2141 family)
MKRQAAAMAAFMAMMTGAGAALAGDVVVELRGIRDGSGPLYVGMQTEGQFLQNAGEYGEIIKAPKAGDTTVVLKDVAPGEYSISVWHDVNGNGDFDRAPDGRPLDGWAMNNAGALRGQPEFDQVKFTVGSGGATLDLEMIYPE